MSNYRHRLACESKGHSWVTFMRHPTDDDHPLIAAWNRKWANHLELMHNYKPTRRACYWCGAINLQMSKPLERRTSSGPGVD